MSDGVVFQQRLDSISDQTHSQKFRKLVYKYFFLANRIAPFPVNPPLSARTVSGERGKKPKESQHPFSLVNRAVKTLRNSRQAKKYSEGF